MKSGFGIKFLHLLLIVLLICPPGFAGGDEKAALPSDGPETTTNPGATPESCPDKIVAPTVDSSAGTTPQQILMAADAASASAPDQAAVDAQIVARSKSILELSKEIKEARTEILRQLDEERVANTQARVAVAREWIAQNNDRVAKELAYAQQQIDAMKSCPISGTVGWAGRQVGCMYWQADKALTHISKFLVPVVIGYTSEVVGLDSAGVQSMAASRQYYLDSIDDAREQLKIAQDAGNTVDAAKYRLWITAFGVQKWTVPYLLGLGSQIKAAVVSAAKWATTRKTEEQKAKDAAVRLEFVQNIGTDFYDAISAFTFSQTLSKSYVFFDYLYRFSLVAAANVIINVTKAIPDMSSLAVAPWHLVANAGTMMLIQAEIAARKTVVATDRLPAKNIDELLQRIAGTIAGRTGFLHESWARINSFMAAVPMEMPVLTLWTGAYLAYMGEADMLTPEGWMVAGGKALTFLSAFGLYLVVKQAVWDKPMDLGFILESRGLAGDAYNDRMVVLAKQHGIPVESKTVLDPATNQVVKWETPAWQGRMWKQWRDCFVPEEKAGENVSYPEFFSYFRSMAWRPRLAKFREDYKRFKEFKNLDAVLELEKSPDGKRKRLGKAVEFAYRAGNTAWDTFVAILLAGGSTKKAEVEKVETGLRGQ